MSQTPGTRKPPLGRSVLRIIKVGISFVVYLWDRVWCQVSRYCRWKFNGRCIVLYYHSVPKEYAKRFEEQMQAVLKLASPIDLRNLEELPGASTRTCVAITFDDCLDSFYENAVPVLLQLNIPATVFAVTDALGGRPAWGEHYYLPDEQVMSAVQLKSLPELITIGSHTMTHRSLVKLPLKAARQEIVGSRQRLEDLLQRPVTLFSFPHGHYSEVLVHQCQDAGYERVFTTEPTCARDGDFVVGRVAADPWDWPLEFRLKIVGAYRWHMSVRTALNRLVRCLSGRSHFVKMCDTTVNKRSSDINTQVR